VARLSQHELQRVLGASALFSAVQGSGGATIRIADAEIEATMGGCRWRA
jgi:hypothetical protein